MTAPVLHLANADRLRAIADEASKWSRTPGVTFFDEEALIRLAIRATSGAGSVGRGQAMVGFDMERYADMLQHELDRLIERSGE